MACLIKYGDEPLILSNIKNIFFFYLIFDYKKIITHSCSDLTQRHLTKHCRSIKIVDYSLLFNMIARLACIIENFSSQILCL